MSAHAERLSPEDEARIRDRFYARGVAGLTDVQVGQLFAHLNAQAEEAGKLLDEVYLLRGLGAWASLVLSQSIPATVAKSYRARVSAVCDELERGAAGQAALVWQEVRAGFSIQRALAHAGASGFLNLPTWRAADEAVRTVLRERAEHLRAGRNQAVEQNEPEDKPDINPQRALRYGDVATIEVRGATSGRELSEDEVAALADEAERGYPVEDIKPTTRPHWHAYPSQHYTPAELQAHVQGMHSGPDLAAALKVEPPLGIAELHDRLHRVHRHAGMIQFQTHADLLKHLRIYHGAPQAAGTTTDQAVAAHDRLHAAWADPEHDVMADLRAAMKTHYTNQGAKVHIRGCQARQGVGLPCTCDGPGRVGDIAGDAPCKTCGRDNRNGTHSALELTGHLSHGYSP